MKQVTFLTRFANFEAGETASFGDDRADAMVKGKVAEFYEQPYNKRPESPDPAVSNRPKSKDKAGK